MPTTNVPINVWSIRRLLGRLRIECTFTAVPDAAAWGMQVRVNGVLVEHRLSEAPLQDSEIAILNAVSLHCDEIDTPCQSFPFPFNVNAAEPSESIG